jgi:hypothetical protein
MTVRVSLISARLTLKLGRFELASGIIAALLIAGAALYADVQLRAVGLDEGCVTRWVASLPTDPTCEARVATWATLNDDIAARIMAISAVLPWLVGLLAGIPVVARELESGTAAIAWSLAGSRTRWLNRQLIPILGCTLLATAAAATTTAWLAETRSFHGIWSATYSDADLSGLPLVVRFISAVVLGLYIGTVVGRVLPALIVASCISAIVVILLAQLQFAVVPPTYEHLSIGSPGYVDRFLTANPDIDVRFVTNDGAVLTLQQAIRLVPVDTPSVGDWLQEHARLVPLGVKNSASWRWQLLETGLLGALSLTAYVMTFRVIRVTAL